MNQFVLAFPIPVAVDEPFAITETAQVNADTKTLMIPGCSVQFNVVRQGASADLLEIFKERDELSAETLTSAFEKSVKIPKVEKQNLLHDAVEDVVRKFKERSI